MARHTLSVMFVATALLAASCGDERTSRRRRSRRDDDDRPAERQPADRTAQPETEASRDPDEARTARRETEGNRPTEPPPAERIGLTAATVTGTWVFESEDILLQLKIKNAGSWILTRATDEPGGGTSVEGAAGTYAIAGRRLTFTTRFEGEQLQPRTATMPEQGKLRLRFVISGEERTRTLTPKEGTQHGEAEEDRVDPQALVGTWKTNSQFGQVTLTLQTDGNFVLEIMSNYAAMPARYYGRYTVAGNRLTLKYGGGMMPDDTSIVHMPNPNLLIAKGLTGVTQEYRRVQQTPAGGQ